MLTAGGSTGRMYAELGFNKIDNSEPGYIYYHIKSKKVFNRMSFQKQKLKGMPFYDENLSEYEIMKLNGYERIWSAGNSRWIFPA